MSIKFGAQLDEMTGKKEVKTEKRILDLPNRPVAEENKPPDNGPDLNIERFMPGAGSFVEARSDSTPGITSKNDTTENHSQPGTTEGRVRDSSVQEKTENMVDAVIGERDRIKSATGGNGHTSKINHDMLMTENSKRLLVNYHSFGAGLIGKPFACASATARAVLGDMAEELAGHGAAPWLIYRTATGVGCVMGVDATTDLATVKSCTEQFFEQKFGVTATVSAIEFAHGEIERLNAVASSTRPVRQAVTLATDPKADFSAAFKQCGVTRATFSASGEKITARLERFGGGKDTFSLEAPQLGTSLLAACEQLPDFLVLDDMATSDTEPFDRVAVDFDQLQHAFNRESSGSIARVGGYGYGVVVIAGQNGSGKTTTAISLAERCASGHDGAVAVIGMRANGYSSRWIQITAATATPEAWKKATIAPVNVIVVKVTSGDGFAGAHIQDAASRGKMVIVSMDASSIPEAISSLTASGMNASFVVNSVHLVAVQSLIPAICPDCAIKDDRESTNQELEAFPLWRKSLPETGTILLKKKGAGCPTCKMTGYIGLNPIIEILDIEQADKEVRKHILNGEFVDVLASINIQKRGWAAGMTMVVRGEIDAADLSRTVRKVVTGK
jgi:hypothetical protein